MTAGSATSPVVNRLHRQSLEAPVREVVALLQDLLSRRLTAYIAGVKSGRSITRWASGEITDIRDPEVEQRLRTAYEIALLLLEHDSRQVVRTWFIGLNPDLGDIPPVEMLRRGHLRETLDAARTFVVAG
jgi:hypothetical protein